MKWQCTGKQLVQRAGPGAAAYVNVSFTLVGAQGNTSLQVPLDADTFQVGKLYSAAFTLLD